MIDELKSSLQETNERLEISQDRIRTLIDVIPVGLLITSASGIIEAANPASLDLFKCEYSDVGNRHLRDLLGIADASALSETLQAAHSGPQELIVRRFDGRELEVAVVARPFRTSTSANKLLVVIEDITARREVERLRQEFISMISHDLRTPLTSIQCFLNLIVAGALDQDLPVLKSQAEAVESDVDRLINMITSLLDIHKLEAGRLELVIEAIPCSSIVNRSLTSVSAWARTRNVPINVSLIPTDLLVKADSDYSVQVLVNLLSNAVKFSPSGATVDVAIEVTDSWVTVLVRDQGPGIDQQFQKKLFNRFEQANLSDARVKGGSGLGLAISKAIVEQQGGNIGVHSDPGQGSAFWFTLERVV